ncbi:MAG TPA: PAS domain S-box protein [Novosphingobium sp.]|nr:PAS domain S-box protein [Novosphingobium sp.]
MTHERDDAARQSKHAGYQNTSAQPAKFWRDGPCFDFTELLEGAGDCIFVLDADWRIIYLNKAAAEEMPDSRSLVGLNIWETFPEARGTPFEREYLRVSNDRIQVHFEAYFAPLQAWYEVKASPLSNGGVFSWFKNINVRKAGEQALAEAEERYRLAASATNDLIWDWIPETNEIRCNQGQKRFGYLEDELGRDREWWIDRIHPDDRQRLLAQRRECLDGGTDRFAIEYRFRKADGAYADIFERGSVVRDRQGQAVRMVGAMQDITLRNDALNRVHEQKLQLSTVFGQAMVGIMHVASSGEVLMANSRFCEILGRDEDELRSADVFSWTHPDDLARVKEIAERHIASGEPHQFEKRYLRADGSVVWCEVSVSFIHPPGGGDKDVIIVAQDISDRKAAEAELARQSSLLQNIIDSVADLVFVKDRAGRYALTNRAMDEGCGVQAGSTCLEDNPDDLLDDSLGVDHEVMTTGELRSNEEEIAIRGDRRLFQTVKVPWIRDGEIAGVIGVARDITERKEAEMALRESEMLYRSVLEASADCITVIDLQGRLELMNSSGLLALGFADFEEIRGTEWTAIWSDRSQDLVRSAINEAREGKVARFTDLCATVHGASKWWDVLVSPICDNHGCVTRILSISRDVTAQRQSAERIRWASEHDGLTTLPNRNSFQARLHAATIRAMESGNGLGLLLIDLDHFKHINDALGHAAGDHLLAEVGKRLKGHIRADDFVARLGGDEFAIILENVADDADLLRVGTSILSRLKLPILFGGRAMSTGASIGGALFPRDAQCAQELFNVADIALYVLKASGRGGTKLFHSDMKQQAQKAASQLRLAREALSEGSVVPHYQRKVDLKTGAVIGHEALLRWRDSSREVQHPGTVEEAFKDYELASRIGEFMQRNALADMRSWLDRGHCFGPVALNAAPAEFLRDDFAERLLGRLHEFDVPPRLIEIEVTEHVFFDRSSEYVRRALGALNDAGVRIALDDFGTGYSSLSHLRDFPVDVVKIDRSFTARITDETEIAAIVAAVISLAGTLRIDVVAEGVETEHQRMLLQIMGCTFGQGFLFGQAVPAEAVSHVEELARSRVSWG